MPRPKPKKQNRHHRELTPEQLARRAEREKAIHEKIITDQAQLEIAERALERAEEELGELNDVIEVALKRGLALRDQHPVGSPNWSYYDGLTDALWSMVDFLDEPPIEGHRDLHPDSLFRKRSADVVDALGEDVSPARRTA